MGRQPACVEIYAATELLIVSIAGRASEVYDKISFSPRLGMRRSASGKEFLSFAFRPPRNFLRHITFCGLLFLCIEKLFSPISIGWMLMFIQRRFLQQMPANYDDTHRDTGEIF